MAFLIYSPDSYWLQESFFGKFSKFNWLDALLNYPGNF